MKFGGTSVGDEKCIARVVSILKHHHNTGNELAVVVSAMSGVTDQLHIIAKEAVESLDEPPIETTIHSLRARHKKVLEAVAPGETDTVMQEIDIKLENLRNILTAIHNLRELTPRSKDYIISFGERLSARIVSAALREEGIPSVPLNGCEAGIMTNERHGCANVLPESEQKIKSRVLPLMQEYVPVVMGYMGCTGTGIVTTLGRSGSDYSAAIVGAAIDAEEIWIWTDVDGIMTSDPRIIPDARVLPDISYLEAMELSYFGAEVLHPRSIEPAMQKGIPVRVKNTFNPGAGGSCVLSKQHRDKRVVKGITYIDKVSLINITGAQMVGRPGVARAIFGELASNSVNIMMISQASSEANISLVVDDEHLDIAISALGSVKKGGYIREVTYDRDICAVAVVGVGMAGTPGISGRIFTALGKNEINLMMISQGSSEVNISFIVKEDDGIKAVKVLHDEFELSGECEE
ncbi:aspartate kinase [Methanoplanus endosymbiosus]|uniref:Aspartokinase n=1 Tax=Methanoplanus endosymbiosus TaxID=33865 RepID=A0A9E7PM76_9EURY|nr:aspartate kinase [Methanoplanus endosymbiosus]UUX91436.1 aspartate kinase [Methanoplanus endosymbiosus]